VPVNVRLPTLMRSYAGGLSTAQANGATIGEVFDDLIRQFPNLKGQVVTEDGQLRRFVNVYLNDEDVRFLDELGTKVADGDEVSIVPAVAGG
jgi:sulfur-carrier protein